MGRRSDRGRRLLPAGGLDEPPGLERALGRLPRSVPRPGLCGADRGALPQAPAPLPAVVRREGRPGPGTSDAGGAGALSTPPLPRRAQGRPAAQRGNAADATGVVAFTVPLALAPQPHPLQPGLGAGAPAVHQPFAAQRALGREIELVLAQPDLGTLLGLRDRAILETLYSTGIRRAELVRLEVVDLSSERATLLVRRGKGGKDRLLPIGRRALGWVGKYPCGGAAASLLGPGAACALCGAARGGAERGLPQPPHEPLRAGRGPGERWLLPHAAPHDGYADAGKRS